MALSNIWREPRREITESAVGLAIAGGYLYLLCRFAGWFAHWRAGSAYRDPNGGDYFGGAVTGIGVTIGVIILLLVSHAIGEGVCNGLARRGIELRPRKRW